MKNIHGGVLILRLQPATLLKLTLLHGCFSRFLNCTNATKSRTEKINNWCEEISKLSEYAKIKPSPVQLIQHFAMVKYTNLHTSLEQFLVCKSMLNRLMI